MLPPLQRPQRNQGFFQPLLRKTKIFKNSFLPYMIHEWNLQDPKIRKIDSYVGFRKKYKVFLNLRKIGEFRRSDLIWLWLIDQRVDFSHLNEHTFRHTFADTLNPLCSCFLETESMAHFFNATEIMIIFV